MGLLEKQKLLTSILLDKIRDKHRVDYGII
jgi:hypothetical protein